MPTGKSLRQRIQRMVSMDRAEFQGRSRQYASQRLDAARHWLGHDWKENLRPAAAQPVGRFFFDAESVPRIIAILRDRLPVQAEAIVQQAERILQHRFDLLGGFSLAQDWLAAGLNNRTRPPDPGQEFFKIQRDNLVT